MLFGRNLTTLSLDVTLVQNYKTAQRVRSSRVLIVATMA